MDKAHKMTDDIIESLEKRLAREYRKANKEVGKKLQDYLDKFNAEDAAQRKLLDAGEITQKEYTDWRYRHMMMNKRWEEMRNTLAEDYHNVNEIARKMYNGSRADVYALNHNYAVYQMEHDAGINTGLTLYNRDAVQRMMTQDPKMLPPPGKKVSKRIAEGKDVLYNNRQIQSVMTQGILQGDSIPELARRLETVTEHNFNAAVRNARTMVTGAQNAGRHDAYERAENLGVHLIQEWQATLDDRTRHDHRMLHGKRIELDEEWETPEGTLRFPGDPLGPPGQVYNCFVPETNIASDSKIVRSYKHEYHGPVVSIETACGVHFTCTPNHPILTLDGWVAANFIDEGDHILVTQIADDGLAGGDPNVNHTHTRIDAIHEFLYELGGKRIRTLSVDFHGDRPTTEVEIITHKGLLRDYWYSRFGKSIDKLLLKSPNKPFMGLGSFSKHLCGIGFPSFGIVRRFCKAFPFFRGRFGHSEEHGIGSVSWFNTTFPEDTKDNLTGEAKLICEALDGASGKVFLDKVISVKVKAFSGHVYNLQTGNGYYFVNSSIAQKDEKCNGIFAIVHNCRCTTLSFVKGFEGDTVTKSPKMGGMSFEDWMGDREDE